MCVKSQYLIVLNKKTSRNSKIAPGGCCALLQKGFVIPVATFQTSIPIYLPGIGLGFGLQCHI